MDITKLQYPVGQFQKPEKIDKKQLEEAIQTLREFPDHLRQITNELSEATLNTPYRPGGWTIRQLVHHIADSHHHCYNRIRWSLTENKPTIKAYDQDAYGNMKDYQEAPIQWSLTHIEVLHQKIVYLLSHLSEGDWERSFVHPETHKEVDIKTLALLYAWHSRHHYAHIKNALN